MYRVKLLGSLVADNQQQSLSVHLDIGTLVEAHVGVADQPLGLVAQRHAGVAPEILRERLRHDSLQFRSWSQLRNVVPILLTCTARKYLINCSTKSI